MAAGSTAPTARREGPSVYLLPNYDEYIVGYTDRSAAYVNEHTDKLDSRGNVVFNHTIVLDGRIVGTWKRTLKKGAVTIAPIPFVDLSADEQRALADAAHHYGEFHNLPVILSDG